MRSYWGRAGGNVWWQICACCLLMSVVLEYEMYAPRVHLIKGALRPHYYYYTCGVVWCVYGAVWHTASMVGYVYSVVLYGIHCLADSMASLVFVHCLADSMASLVFVHCLPDSMASLVFVHCLADSMASLVCLYIVFLTPGLVWCVCTLSCWLHGQSGVFVHCLADSMASLVCLYIVLLTPWPVWCVCVHVSVLIASWEWSSSEGLH